MTPVGGDYWVQHKAKVSPADHQGALSTSKDVVYMKGTFTSCVPYEHGHSHSNESKIINFHFLLYIFIILKSLSFILYSKQPDRLVVPNPLMLPIGPYCSEWYTDKQQTNSFL